MGGGPSITVPEKTPEERALLAKQTDILDAQFEIIKAQADQQEKLAPFLYKELGLEATLNENGQITGFSEIPDPNAELRSEIETGLLERSAKALRGELEVDPGLTRDLRNQEDQLHNVLRKRLGPGYETSTPGRQALNDFAERKNIILSGARRAELTLAEQLGLSRENQDRLNSQFFTAGNAAVGGLPLQTAGALGANAQGFNAPLNQLFQERQLQTNVNLQNAQMASQSQAALFGGIGKAAGFGLGFLLAK